MITISMTLTYYIHKHTMNYDIHIEGYDNDHIMNHDGCNIENNNKAISNYISITTCNNRNRDTSTKM